jgi:uncharacterized protein YggE
MGMRPKAVISTAVTLAAVSAMVAGCGSPATGAAGPARGAPASPAGATPSATAQLAGSLAGPGAPTTAVTATSAPARITTTGTGTVDGTPDQLAVTIGVQTSAAHVSGALDQNNSSSAAVQAALTADGVSPSDVQTSDLSLYQQDPGSGGGYQASDSITATVRDLKTAGRTIDDALRAAGDAGRLEGVSFSFANDSGLLAQARQAAVADARTQAQELARAAGVTLGGLLAITGQQEQGGGYPVAFSASSSAASAASPVPVQPGTEQTSVSVTTVWAIA